MPTHLRMSIYIFSPRFLPPPPPPPPTLPQNKSSLKSSLKTICMIVHTISAHNFQVLLLYIFFSFYTFLFRYCNGRNTCNLLKQLMTFSRYLSYTVPLFVAQNECVSTILCFAVNMLLIIINKKLSEMTKLTKLVPSVLNPYSFNIGKKSRLIKRTCNECPFL